MLFDSTPDEISFYIIEPLKKILTELIDFDRINHDSIKLTLCSVEIKTGETVYSDNKKDKISINHVLASCALPPGFPAVKIDGKYYWDGGVLTNAPFNVLLDEPNNVKTICFLAHLFDSLGLLSKNLDDVLKRYKDIIYSSHFKTVMENYKIIHCLRYTLGKFSKQIPNEIKNDASLKKITNLNEKMSSIHFVRCLYHAPTYELSSKDFEFSTLSMSEKMEAGYRDAIDAITQSPWMEEADEKFGISIHEFYHDLKKLAKIQNT